MPVLQSLKGLASALFAPAKDPRATLAYTYHHQTALLNKVREGIATMQATRDHIGKKINVVTERIPKLEDDARQALALGDEMRARFALQRKQIALLELEGLEAQCADVSQEEKRLTMIEQRLTAQMEVVLARQELIAARHSAAEAQVTINQEIGSVSEELEELDSALAEAEARAERLRERATALDKIAAVNTLHNKEHVSSARVAQNIQRLNLTDAVEEALEQLKKEDAS